MTGRRPPRAWRRHAGLLLAEPTVRFFLIAGLLFVAHRLVVGDPRVIVVSPGVKADLERRFRDNNDGRAPSPAELDSAIRTWERDEALYREALRDRLDRDDATIRTVLADRMRARAAAGVSKRDPSAAELDRWLATHRSLYETPRRYDYQVVAFPKSEPRAAEQLEKFDQALKAGANPASPKRPIMGGNLTADELRERLGPALAAHIASLPVGDWQRFEDQDRLLLMRLVAVQGGLLNADELHRRLVSDWSFADKQRAVDEAVQVVVGRYRFEERR
jgi:hypothetical protein